MTGFTGEVKSDFLKVFSIPDSKKEEFINFAGSDFLDLRDSLINYIKAVYPLDYNNFQESDLGVMLIELVAYMGAVVSLKSDMLANENYLKTAKKRTSVKKLLELIGIRMLGPAAAAATAKLTFDGVPSYDASNITIPAGKRVFSITSPEDGTPVNYTLYKVDNNGTLDPMEKDSGITLNVAESDNMLSSVYTNLALLEGAFITEEGEFTSLDTVQRISLNKSPVIEGSVNVYVSSLDESIVGSWDYVENLYFDSTSGTNKYQIVYDDTHGATIVFGDGVAANSPPTGAKYFVNYRVGGGTRGNIKSEVINVPITIGLDSGIVENISMATGGADAETLEHAKKYGPLAFKQINRLVTLEDYTSFCNRFVSTTGKTGKALAATRKAYSSGNVIDIYTLEKASDLQLQKASPTYKKELLDDIDPLRMVTDDIVIVDGVIRTVDLVITSRVDKELRAIEEVIKQKIMRTIKSFFDVNNMDFGKTLVLGELNREIFSSLKEVRYSTVDNIEDDITTDFNEIIQLNNATVNIEYV